MRVVEPEVKLLAITPMAEKLIEQAGRTCYKSENLITDESSGKFIKMIIKRGHHSVLEHASATLRFICDRGVTHELVRHRLASYSQESTRYCDYSNSSQGIGFIQPPFLSQDTLIVWKTACANAENSYNMLRGSGHSPQIARSVLPICVKTEIVATANLREWRHILVLRTSGAAHPQIRRLMIDARGLLYRVCPTVFEDIINDDSK